jgi:hypothetical protein
MAIVLVILVFVAIGGFLLVSYLRRRSSAFEGTITDKDVQEIVNNTKTKGISIGSNNVQHHYFIKVQTDAGQTIKYPVSEGKYEQAAIGDKVSKSAGTTDIEIIKAIPNPPSPTAVPPQPPAGIAN